MAPTLGKRQVESRLCVDYQETRSIDCTSSHSNFDCFFVVIQGWIHRSMLKQRGVTELSGCKYIEVNDEGFVIERSGKRTVLEVIDLD